MPPHRKKIWFKLDNAAKLYPSVSSARLTTLFRLSITLQQRINVSILQNSLKTVISRLSYFQVNLRKGFFWYYFEQNNKIPLIEPDSKYPCTFLPFKKYSRFPYRIRVYDKRIALEISHSLTDGTGALNFLKIITYQYLNDSGFRLPYPDNLPDLCNDIQDWEYEDSFKKYYKKGIPQPENLQKAFHLPDKLLARGKYIITSASFPSSAIVKLAKKHNVSVTIYLLAVYIKSFLDHISIKSIKIRKPLRIMVPVNLRNVFPSETMLNFFLTVGPEIDPRLGDYTFDEILDQVNLFMKKEINSKFMLKQISRNVGSEKSLFIRIIPRFIKDPVLQIIYRRNGQNLSTSSISNLGIVDFQKEYYKYIQRIDFIPAPSAIHKTAAAVLSFNGRMYINFGRVIRDPGIEKLFLRHFSDKGIDITVHSNEVNNG